MLIVSMNFGGVSIKITSGDDGGSSTTRGKANRTVFFSKAGLAARAGGDSLRLCRMV
jgi:hypothetical protein